jgi:hypothetical protein
MRGNTISLTQQGSHTARKRKTKISGSRGIHSARPKAVK